MRTLLLLVPALLLACAPAEVDVGTGDDDFTADARTEEGFHAKDSCESGREFHEYVVEIDLTDREKPKYRIHHGMADRRILGEQNMRISLRDGTVWESDDLKSYPFAWQGFDRENPWIPLPLPKDFLDKAFQVVEQGRYNLEKWEVTVNVPQHRDPSCGHDFYRTP